MVEVDPEIRTGCSVRTLLDLLVTLWYDTPGTLARIKSGETSPSWTTGPGALTPFARPVTLGILVFVPGPTVAHFRPQVFWFHCSGLPFC